MLETQLPNPVVAEPRTAAPMKWWAATGAVALVFNSHDPEGGAAPLDPDGNLVVPPNTKLPGMGPFESGK
jgi:hypothetical protein